MLLNIQYLILNIVKLQSQVLTSVLGLGVNFVLILSQQEQHKEEEPFTKIYQKGVYSSSEIWHLTHRLYILFKDQHQNFKSESWVWHWRPKSCLNTFYTKFENFSTRCMNALCHAKKYHVWRHAYTMCDIFIHVWRHISYLQLLHIFVFARISDILNQMILKYARHILNFYKLTNLCTNFVLFCMISTRLNVSSEASLMYLVQRDQSICTGLYSTILVIK